MGSVSITTNDITHNSDNGSVELNVYLEELKNSVANGKQLLADAISTISSVYTQNTDTFTTMASNILELKSFNQYYYLQYPTTYNKYDNNVRKVMATITNAGYDPFLWHSTTNNRFYIRLCPYSTLDYATNEQTNLSNNNITMNIIDANTNNISL